MFTQANYTSDRGVRVIRPLMYVMQGNECMLAWLDSICSYVREMMTRAYADAALLPVIEDNCPACFKVIDCHTLCTFRDQCSVAVLWNPNVFIGT
jgi:hypothetical protein